VLAVLSFFVPVLPAIVALVLAAVAARRIRAAPAGVLGGSGLVTAARALAAIGLLVWVGLATLLVVVVTQVEEPRGRGTVTDAGLPSAREVGVDALEVGDCVNDATLRGEGRVVTVDLVPCGQPHDLEVYANATMPGGDFPGDQAVERFGDRSCVARFREYVGIPFRDSEFDYYFYWPSEDSWNAGDRVVTCAVVDADGGKLTGSVRGARR
jgi:Septum formation